MTDNEIIKALKKHSMGLCSNCKVEKTTLCNNCISEIERNALDLINRQQAQLADERAKIEICAETISRQDAEIERLNNNISAMATTLSNSAKETKAEAIKEFAERLKANSQWLPLTAIPDSFVTVSNIDNLVKEMVGEDETT